MKHQDKIETPQEIALRLGISPENFEESYIGKFDSPKEMAILLARDDGIYTKESWPYLDYDLLIETYTHDLGIISDNGHYFITK